MDCLESVNSKRCVMAVKLVVCVYKPHTLAI